MRSPHVTRYLSLVLLVLLVHPAHADGWRLRIVDNGFLPGDFLLVDKEAQEAYILKKDSPLRITGSFPCTTGQAPGDKLVEDDKKTPEGVYFVGKKVTGLDYREYGGTAYTLNYPNPVDRLRNKTGYGIWVHSKGHTITPNETVGCVALNLDDLRQVGNSLVPGYPVVVTASASADLDSEPGQASTAQRLSANVEYWARLWSGRSTAMFDLYDGESYTMAQKNETFADFTAVKSDLFQTLPWLTVTVSDVRALPGPGYWVTWFKQLYVAPNLTTEGIRRLYWQEKNGEWRIVGMEWIPQNIGLVQGYYEEQKAAVLTLIERWRSAWQHGDLDRYAECYSHNAVQGALRGRDALSSHKRTLWSQSKNRDITFSSVTFTHVDGGRMCVTMQQSYRDSGGYSDRGIKRIMLERTEDGWLISDERWSAR